MAINKTIASAGLGAGSPLKSTIYTDLNQLLANDIDLDARVTSAQNVANSVNGQMVFRNCGGNCTGSCFGYCTGSCIGCSSCTGGCIASCGLNCVGGCSSSCGGCSGH